MRNKLLALLLLGMTQGAHANEGSLYAYINQTHTHFDQIQSDNLEARFKFKYAQFSARPILTLAPDSHLTLSQWQFKQPINEQINLSIGRELLNWGAAQFRSPSSPFYFNNGRSNPIKELSGIDALKISYAATPQQNAYLAYTPHNTWLAKFDQYGDDWTIGLVAKKTPQQALLLGIHSQITLNDNLLAYSEIAHTPDNTLLIGGNYTLENGQSLIAEYLRNTPSLHSDLRHQDYLYLAWQSNLMSQQGYWRMMFSHNLNDYGTMLAAYREISFNQRYSGFALAALNGNKPQQEFSAQVTRSITLGLKVTLF